MIVPDAGTRIHFVGIGGIGMSALAELLHLRGWEVTGTDRVTSSVIDRLQDLGIRVDVGHRSEAVSEADLLVYTPAVGPDNPELMEAARRKIQTVKRAELLGELAKEQRVVAVTGTHGKTTTTAMMGAVLEAAGMDPTVLVGGIVQGDERNLRVGSGQTWVLEADEFDRSFLQLHPHVAVVTSLEADHLDSYGTLDAIVDAYQTFVESINEGGYGVLNAEAPAVCGLRLPSSVERRTFGVEEGCVRARNIEAHGFKTRFSVTEMSEGSDADVAEIELQAPGRHNVMNALAAAAAARALEVEWPSITEGLKSFGGVRRRFEVIGEAAGVTVVSDYAHHPTEIEATLTTARERHVGRLVVLFQPHLYTRTRDLAGAFAGAFSAADRVFLTDIYPAREAPIPGVDGAMLAKRVAAAGQEGVTFLPELDEAIDAAADDAQPGDLLVVMGAGDVERAAPAVLERLRRHV